jgi:adenosine deaminase
MRILVDLIRNHGPEAGWPAARFAAKSRHLGVVGINLGGDEANFPAGPYAEIYAFARDQGLGLTAHAGEAAGPESVWTCVEELGVERLGHAARAAEDPKLLDVIAARGIVIEACPTSNVLTGAVRSFEAHPLGEFVRAGCRVCLNTDDPTFFGCTLSGEHAKARQAFGFDDEALAAMNRHAWTGAFDAG